MRNFIDIDEQLEDLIQTIEESLVVEQDEEQSNEQQEETTDSGEEETNKEELVNDQKQELSNNITRLITVKDILETVLNNRYDEELSTLLDHIRTILVRIVDKIKAKNYDNIESINSELESILKLSLEFIKRRLSLTDREVKEKNE